MIAYAEEISEQSQEQAASPFDGFEGFSSPADWSIISAFIDNLAEFKVVEWLQRNIWDEWVEITTEMFIHGYDDGVNIDCGTGLSKPSVIQGIKRAVAHGLIEVDIDATDPTHIRKFYRMKIAEVKRLSLADEPEYTDTQDFYLCDEETSAQTDDFYPVSEQGLTFFTPSNNSNNISINTNCNRLSRIQSLEALPEKGYSNTTHKAKEKYPEFIRAVLKYLSVELGDGEHIASNIAQASRIYKQSGLSEEAFTQLLYDLESAARNKRGIKRINSRGWPNRMPYFFACLKKSAIVTSNC